MVDGKMSSNQTDPFGRTVDYLRISITDRCNERCLYCLPENYADWLPRGDILSYDELLAIVRATTALGFKRFRVTGGEPLIRPGVVEFIRDLVATPGVESVQLTTNGTRLPDLAQPLFDAGLRRLNISLDAARSSNLPHHHQCDVAPVLEGIKRVKQIGFRFGEAEHGADARKNDDEFSAARFAAEHDIAIRFIELMPVSLTEMLSEKNFTRSRNCRQVAARRRAGAGCGKRLASAGQVLPPQQRGTTVGLIGRIEATCISASAAQDAADLRRQAASLPWQSSGDGSETGVAPAD